MTRWCEAALPVLGLFLVGMSLGPSEVHQKIATWPPENSPSNYSLTEFGPYEWDDECLILNKETDPESEYVHYTGPLKFFVDRSETAFIIGRGKTPDTAHDCLLNMSSGKRKLGSRPSVSGFRKAIYLTKTDEWMLAGMSHEPSGAFIKLLNSDLSLAKRIDFVGNFNEGPFVLDQSFNIQNDDIVEMLETDKPKDLLDIWRRKGNISHDRPPNIKLIFGHYDRHGNATNICSIPNNEYSEIANGGAPLAVDARWNLYYVAAKRRTQYRGTSKDFRILKISPDCRFVAELPMRETEYWSARAQNQVYVSPAGDVYQMFPSNLGLYIYKWSFKESR